MDFRPYLFAAMSAAAMMVTCGPVQAQSPNSAELDDSEHWFEAARQATDAGDLPRAVIYLERILLTNPNLANIKLELGLIYLRLGDVTLARRYLSAAADAPEAPEPSRLRAREALRQIDKGLRRFSASGTIQLGGQYQTNPNAAPTTVSVVGAGGLPVLIGSDRLSIDRGDDVSGSIYGSTELRFGLGGQRGTDLVAQLAGSYTRYATQTRLNTLFLDGQFGPRFSLGPTATPNGFIRPFGEIIHLGLGDAEYFTGYGGGLAITYQLGPRSQLAGQFGYQHRDYQNSRDRPTSSTQTGEYFSGFATLYRQVTSHTLLDFGVIGEHVDARRDFWSRDTIGASIGASQNLKLGKLGAIGRLSFGYRHSGYDAPDPLVNLALRRREDRFDLGGVISVPLKRSITLDLALQQQWNNANIPNYDYSNTYASLTFSYRF